MRTKATRRRGGGTTRGGAIATGLLAVATASAVTTGNDECVLIRKGLSAERITLLEIAGPQMSYLDARGNGRTIGLDGCLGVYDPDARFVPVSDGLLELADGQRLPGQAISNADPGEEVVAWNHLWLGRLDVPLDQVRSMRLRNDVVVLPPGDADQVQLVNGDLIKGFVVALGDPISLEVDGADGPQLVDVPIERAAAVAMVTPTRPAVGRRVWFRDGTVLDAHSIRIDDGGEVRIESPLLTDEAADAALQVEQVAAILFDSRGMLPLAALAPSSMSGPDYRYTLPAPRLLDPEAPLGLAAIEYRGPLIVRYILPAGARRFAAEARVPEGSRTWADLDLVVRDDDRIVSSTHLDAAHPEVEINVELHGSELTIELTEGGNGPVQDVVVLTQAMVMLEE